MQEWYWVRTIDKWNNLNWFPAYKDQKAAGGWTNGDTWEDFGFEVVEWIKIPTPEELKKGE